MNMAEPFPEKSWNLFLLLNTKGNFSSNWSCRHEQGICVDKDVFIKKKKEGKLTGRLQNLDPGCCVT